jgi:hypothetical protein
MSFRYAEEHSIPAGLWEKPEWKKLGGPDPRSVLRHIDSSKDGDSVDDILKVHFGKMWIRMPVSFSCGS